MKGKLYLLPTVLDAEYLDNIPADTRAKTLSLKHFIVENLRTTRRYLKKLDKSIDIDAIQFHELDKHNKRLDFNAFFKGIKKGHDVGLISEAGCPGIADPGQRIVARAHKMGIQVVPMTGPSSIFLALMASGLNGQKFRFQGYLPIDDMPRREAIRFMEKDSRFRKETQIFMETPYRNNQLLKLLVRELNERTRLCVAVNISSPNESIRTMEVGEWKKDLPDIHKIPAIFLFLHP